MPVAAIELKQNPDNPDIRYLQVTYEYDPGRGAQGYPEQYLLTKEQFAQMQNSGLTAQITRDPLYYNKGDFSSNISRFNQFANDPIRSDLPSLPKQNAELGQRVANTFASQKTTGGTDLATDTAARQKWLDYAVGGSKNPLTPGGLNAQVLEAAKNGEMVDPLVLKTAQEGGDIIAALSQAYPAAAAGLQETFKASAISPSTPEGTTGAQANNVSTIPFKAGLSATQQQSITNIAQNKPVSIWTDEDKKNWAYATNNAPLPTGKATGEVVQGDGGRVYAKNPDGTYTYIPDQKSLENYVFQQGYKDVRSSGTQSIPSQQMTGAQGTSTPTSANTPTPSSAGAATAPNNLTAAFDIIDKSNLSPDLKKLFKDTVQLYPDSTVNTDAIMATFNKIKTDTIDPYYYNLVKATETDLRSGLQNLQIAREQELETQRALEGQNIRQARSDLEKRGMTFSGEGIEQLGAKSAYSQQPGTAIPSQTAVSPTEDLTTKGGMTFTAPFGGDQRYFEGTVNQANRLMATSSAARQQSALQQLGRKAEDTLGTAGAAGLGISYTPAGGQIGSIPEAQQKQYASTLSQLYGNQQRKEDLNTNINPFQ